MSIEGGELSPERKLEIARRRALMTPAEIEERVRFARSQAFRFKPGQVLGLEPVTDPKLIAMIDKATADRAEKYARWRIEGWIMGEIASL